VTTPIFVTLKSNGYDVWAEVSFVIVRLIVH